MSWDTCGAKILYDSLVAYDVKYIFGMDSPEPLYEVIERNGRKIKPVLIHHEAMGALMATGYAEVAFKPGICCGDRGAGVTNLVTGIGEAWKSSVPVIAIGGGTQIQSEDKNAAQDLDQVGLFKPITKAVIDVRDSTRFAEIVRRAFRIATSGRPGPVFLNVRPDALEDEAGKQDVYAEEEYSKVPGARIAPDPEKTVEAAKMLLAAERPCIIAGGGALMSQAWEELRQLAELMHIPVATTIMAKGVFPETHPLSLGAIGAYISGKAGHGAIANKVVKESDVVLIVGSRTDEMSTLGWRYPSHDSKIIHIDIDPNEIGRNYRTQVGIVADAKLGLAALYGVLKAMKDKETVKKAPRVEQIEKLRREWWERNLQAMNDDSTPIRSQRLYKEIREFVDENTIVVSDASQASAWAASHLESLSVGKTFVQPRGLGALGMALPLALGAQIAEPGKRVFCIAGDGGFMVGQTQELETALRYGLNVVVFVLNNQTLGGNTLVEETLWHSYNHEAHFSNVDFAKVAQGFGCWGKSVEDPKEIRATVQEALRANSPALIDVKMGFATKEILADQLSVFSLGIWGGEE